MPLSFKHIWTTLLWRRTLLHMGEYIMRHITTAIVLISTMVALPLQAQMLADITTDVETEFGTYRPYLVNVIPALESYTVEPDFSNVNNFSSEESRFDSVDLAFLSRNHFTVKRSQYQQLYDIYNACTWDGMPIFVTTDAVLHTYHVLFDRFLAEIEVQQFVELLGLMTDTLLDSAQSVSDQSTKPEVQEAAERNVAFLSVAARLLEGDGVPVPETVSALVDAELVLISNHDGFHCSPIFGPFSELDYSQFLPRGHYTKNDTLRAYFKTMMWYGWTIFTMEPDLFGDLSRRHTLQALMLVQMLNNLDADGQHLLDVWEDMYETTCFFVGKTDDPNVRDYEEIAVQVYGTDFLSLSADSLADVFLLDAFMTETQELPEPKIPNWIYGTFTTYKGFRFMGQRFIPDSYMFAHLVLPEVPDRFFPKGLDVMAILGSERAYMLLDSVYQETAYLNYHEKMAEFKTEFAALPAETWAQNLYWNWLYCLMPLLYEKGAGYPVFMQSLAWADKELMSALASWAELRHDTILYAKQSMTPCGIAPGPPRSYVEPNPYLYARLASLVRYTREGLQSRGLLLEGFGAKLDLFEELLLFLKDMSLKELENIPLSASDYENIFCFGKVMEELITEVKDPQKPWEKEADDMAVIADVHTDSNSDLCLEEGVGYPLEIFVIVSEGGTIRITRGAMFSYYEFTQPIADRLTNETWREMLAGDTPPAMPEWASNFINITAAQPSFWPDSPDNLYMHEFLVGDLAPADLIPKTIRLEQNYPNPFNPVTTIAYDLPVAGEVSLIVYNLLGREVTTLVKGFRAPGRYTVRWNASDVSSGLYFVRLRVGGFCATRKMVVLK